MIRRSGSVRTRTVPRGHPIGYPRAGGAPAPGRLYATGNALMRGALDTPIPLIGALDFSFSLYARYGLGGANVDIFSKAGSTNFCQLSSTDGGDVLRLTVQTIGVRWQGISALLTDGEYFKMTITNPNLGTDVMCTITTASGSTVLGYVAGWNQDISSASADFNLIGQSSGGGAIFNGPIKDLEFIQSGVTYFYPFFQENPSILIVNYGGDPAFNGTWTSPNFTLIDPDPWDLVPAQLPVLP